MESRTIETQSRSTRRFLPMRNFISLPRSYVVSKLLGWKQFDEDERWSEKAVNSLVKRLKVKRDAIQELEQALSHPGVPSKCVTIPRTHDGRLQILHRKDFPHVIYCRIWRWPNLQSHQELKPLPECQFAFSKKLKEVCVNPYHYNRVKVVILPPVMVPKHYDYVLGHSLFPIQQLSEPITPQTVNYTQNDFTGLDLDAASLISPLLQQQSSNLIEMQTPALDSVLDPALDPVLDPAFDSVLDPAFDSVLDPAFDSVLDPVLDPALDLALDPALDPTLDPILHPALYPPLNQAYSNLIEEMNINAYEPTESQLLPQPINCEDQQYWASIAYYEFNQPVGEIFYCKGMSIIVDGYTNLDETGDRFCLGQLSNIYRNSTMEKLRKQIGKGIHLYYVNGQVYVECLSNASIFVQSKIFNHENRSHPLTVCKIQSGGALKIFDNSEFFELLSQCVNRSSESVSKLTEMCRIRIAFVKGWGAKYSSAEITSTPSWIEVQLYGPLTWLDRVLTEMAQPTNMISSVS